MKKTIYPLTTSAVKKNQTLFAIVASGKAYYEVWADNEQDAKSATSFLMLEQEGILDYDAIPVLNENGQSIKALDIA